jgi:hypothetical protein
MKKEYVMKKITLEKPHWINEIGIMLKDWWWNIDTLFTLSFEANLFNISCVLNVLNTELKLATDLPHFHVPYLRLHFDFTHVFKNSHKGLEIEVMADGFLTTGLTVYSTLHCDHAGFHCKLVLLGYSFELMIYDERHWDYDKNTWEEWAEY